MRRVGFCTIALVAFGTSCGGKTSLSIAGDGATPDADPLVPSTGDTGATSAGGSPTTQTSAVVSTSGGVSSSSVGIGVTSTGGSTAGAGGEAPGAGGWPPTEGSFYFLGTTKDPEPPIGYDDQPRALNQYRPEAPPALVVDPGFGYFFLADPPVPPSTRFLMGYDYWEEGPNELIVSFDVRSATFFVHGSWGASPWGRVSTTVDAAVQLNEETFILLRWVAANPRSQLWAVNTTVDAPYAIPPAPERDELLREFPETRLGYHGRTTDQRAVFSDGKNLFFVAEDRTVEEVAGADEVLEVVGLSHAGSALLTVGTLQDTWTIRVFDGDWLEARAETSLVPDSVTWGPEPSVLYEADDEVYQWDPYAGTSPEQITPIFADYRPRGRSVSGDFGTALSVQSPSSWAIAFLEQDGLQTCGPTTLPIRALQPYVRAGVSGVLFDEFDREDEYVFGTIYFCSPGAAPVDLLTEHGILGRLPSSQRY